MVKKGWKNRNIVIVKLCLMREMRMGNNPMVGMTVAVAVAVEEASK